MAASTPAPDAADVPLRGVRARAFARVLPRAAEQISDRFRVLRVAKHAFRRLSADGHNPMGRASDDAKTLIRLLIAYANNDYRSIPWKSAVYALGALLYFLSPLDLIPDVLVGIGFLDDVAVVVAVVKAISGDLDAFRAWEAGRGRAAFAVDASSAASSTASPEVSGTPRAMRTAA